MPKQNAGRTGDLLVQTPKGSVWFRCKGCGKPAAYFPHGMPPHYAPGSVAHSKPPELVRAPGEPSQVTCSVYQQLSPSEYWELHRDAPRLDPPDHLTERKG